MVQCFLEAISGLVKLTTTCSNARFRNHDFQVAQRLYSVKRQAQNHSSGCWSGRQAMQAVRILGSICSAKVRYSTSPPDLQG